ncbi:hypothetical protein M432DRAFT_588354 [Thermoascus aurantiacus ATCC 26904]
MMLRFKLLDPLLLSDFIHYGPDGKPVTSKVPIRIGDPEETYVTIPPDVGRALQTASLTGDVSSSSPESLGDRFKLTCSTILKTLLVTQSPATLFLYGKMHTLAIDGTADAYLAEIASTIGPDLGPVLDKLKDM